MTHEEKAYITNISIKKKWVEESDSDKRRFFNSFDELKDYILKNFDRLALSYNPPLSELWIYVLSIKFGARDWSEGIEECGYNTRVNGYVTQYSGEKIHHDCGVVVFGTRATGDAYYAYDGGIFIKFLKGSIVEKNKRLQEITEEQEKLLEEKKRIESSL